MKRQQQSFGSYLEAIVYPLLLLSVMWTVYWAQRVSGNDLVSYGIRPHHWESWKGVLFMPLLHSPHDYAHIINNSFPTAVLLYALIYYYRSIALKVFTISWLVTGIGVWAFAKDDNAYHIGMSGVIYALFGFLFISGFFRNYRPLQAISLFVVFVYGSMFWGIFPQKENISWEGHLSGMAIGIFLAVMYRKQGPQGPKYQYEIEKELGIEPPDLEGMWLAREEAMERHRQEMERQRLEHLEQQSQPVGIIYHHIPSKPDPNTPEEKPQDGSEAK